MGFATGTVAELLYAMPAAVTKNTYTTIAAYTGVAGTNPLCSIPPGYIGSGKNPVGMAFYLRLEGIIGNTAAATFANAINVNPTVATSTGNITINTAYTPTASVTAPFHVEALMTVTAFATSTFTIQISGGCKYESVASGGAPSTSSQSIGFQGTIASLDPRVRQYVELFGTWSASNAANSTTVHQMLLLGLN